jgi:hypothetical protein
MPVSPRLHVKDLVALLNHCERDIKALAREAINRQEGVEWPVLRDRTTGAPLMDQEGLVYAVVQAPPNKRGRPREGYVFRPVQPPQGYISLAERYLLSGRVLSKNHQIITAIAAEAGIIPGAPVRVQSDNTSAETTQVITAKEPGPVHGILLRPEGTAEGWKTKTGDHVEVLVEGTVLLPAVGPIGYGVVDRLLWDPKDLCWCSEPERGLSLLQLRGSWGLDHSSQAGELAAAFIDGNLGLRLEQMHPEPGETHLIA